MDFANTGSFASHVRRNKTYVIAVLERVADARVHVVVIERHEGRVDHDAESDEQIDERIEDDERQELSQTDVDVTTVPHAEDVDHAVAEGHKALLQPRAFVVLVAAG